LFWLELKRTGVLVIAAVNLGLLMMALRAYQRRGALPDGYYQLSLISPAAAAMNLILGLSFWASGIPPMPMHIFYGSMVGVGAALQLVLGRRTALGHRYRAKPAVHGFLALFVMLIAIRAWMAA
jgi:hypothetical protein